MRIIIKELEKLLQGSLIFVLFLLSSPLYGQNLECVPIDTLNDIAISLKLAIDPYDSPHIIYVDSDALLTKHGFRQGETWDIEEIDLYTSIDNLFIDENLDIHCSDANYDRLDYIYISGTNANTQIIDDTILSYLRSDIYYNNGLEVVSSKYGPQDLLLEYRYNNPNWSRDEIADLPQFSILSSHVYFNDTHYATFSSDSMGTWINYAQWNEYSFEIETIADDSVSGPSSLAVDSDGNPWILYNRDGNHNLNLVLANKQNSIWQYEAIDTAYGSLLYKLIYSNYEDKVYFLVRDSSHLLYLCNKVDGEWNFHQVFEQTVDDFDIAIDTCGGVHACFIAEEDIGNVLYYCYKEAPNSINDEILLLPEDVGTLIAYPNPFNSTVSFQIKSNSSHDGVLKIYDIAGRLVLEINIVETEASYVSVQWDGKNGVGDDVSSGIYFARYGSGSNVETTRVVLLR